MYDVSRSNNRGKNKKNILEKIIPNAGLVIYEGCSHYAYLERINQTIRVLKEFYK